MTAEQTIREDVKGWALEDLQRVVEEQLAQLHLLLYKFERGGAIDIYTVEVIEDITYKLDGVLYCKSNCHYCVDPLRDAYYLARDIAYIGNIVHMSDITTIGERVARLIYNYARENEELWESDE